MKGRKGQAAESTPVVDLTIKMQSKPFESIKVRLKAQVLQQQVYEAFQPGEAKQGVSGI